MNSSTDLLKRLVDLLPTANLRGRVADPEIKAKADLVQTIVNGAQPLALKQSVLTDFNSLKQHVYVHDFQCAALNAVSAPFAVDGEQIRSAVAANLVVHDYLYTLTFSVTAFDKEEHASVDYEIEYLWPVRVECKIGYMIVKFGIIERDMLVPAGVDYMVLSAKRDLDESMVLAEIIAATPVGTVATRANLDRGIKKVWDLNHVDTPFINFQKSDSTSTEAMNAGCFLKDKYPADYALITAKPLLRTVFERRGNTKDFPKRFTIDPQSGFLMFSLYPDNVTSVDHALSQIILNN